MSVSVCMYVLLEYLSDIYLLFSLPHIHMHITQIHPVVFFWCITSVVLLLIPSFPSITTGLHHTSCLRACMRVCLLIGALPCQSHRSPASSPPRCLVIGSALADGGGGGRGCCHLLYLCRPPLSPEPVSSPAWNRQILPHLSWQCSCPSVCNTLTCMRTYININIYIYVHTVHIWVASMDPGVCCSTNSVQQVFQTMDQHLTADMAKLVIFSFFHFYHTPRGTNRHFLFLFRNLKSQRGQRWICDITACRLNSKETVRGQLEAGTPVEAILTRLGQIRTIVGGDWEVNEQQTSQQYSPVDMFSSRPRGGMQRVRDCAGGDVAQAKPIADCRITMDPCSRTYTTSPDPFLAAAAAAEMDTKPFKRLSERQSYPRNLQYKWNTAELSSTNHIPNCHPLQITIRFFSVALKPQCLYPLVALNPIL